MKIKEALNEAAVKAGYKNWNDVENNPRYGGSSIRAIAARAMEIFGKEQYNEGINDCYKANEQTNKLLDGLREKFKYNEAYNQAVQDISEKYNDYLPYTMKGDILKLLK